MAIKFYNHYFKKPGTHSIFLINSAKQMSNNYTPCFNRIGFVVIPFYIELPCPVKAFEKRTYADVDKNMIQVENMNKLLINAVCCSIIENKDIVQSLFLMKRKIYCIDMYNRIFRTTKNRIEKVKMR